MSENLYRCLITETDVCSYHIKHQASQTTGDLPPTTRKSLTSLFQNEKPFATVNFPRLTTMSRRQIPPFTSSHDVLPYIARHRWELTIPVIMDFCTWAMNPAAVERDSIPAFIQSLPRFQLEELSEKDCPICLDEYGTYSPSDTPTKLPCGHILGANCMYSWLMSGRNTCPQCRQEIYFRPVPLELYSDLHLQLLEVRGAGRVFLEDIDGQFDQSYFAFCRWATRNGMDVTSTAYRRLALNTIETIETLARSI